MQIKKFKLHKNQNFGFMILASLFPVRILIILDTQLTFTVNAHCIEIFIELFTITQRNKLVVE